MTPTDVKLNAQALLNICVRGTPNEGGVASNLGQNGALALRVTPYRPNVRCKERGTAPPPPNCRKILDLMPTDGKQLRFGPRGDPTVQISVPKNFVTAEAQCVVTIDTNSQIDVSNWYKIWAAGIAIENMCVEANRAGGVAIGLGRFVVLALRSF